LLQDQGFEVLVASNGLEALTIASEEHYNLALIISDIVMPQMGGLDLHSALREKFPEIKVLLISGHPLNEPSRALIRQGVAQVLQKPFSVQEFNRTVANLLNMP